MQLKSTVVAALGVALALALALGACASQTATDALREASGPSESECSSFQVGDRGPGGGIIFYKDMNRPEGSRCFEAAPSGWKGVSDQRARWGCNGTAIPGTGTAIGVGRDNTAAIVGGCSTAGIAARLADDYAGGGLSDWFLPSKDELNKLYAQKTAVGGFADGRYWSSSQGSAGYAWLQRFVDGRQYIGDEVSPYLVRPVRAF